jgi:hypothetical protein
MKLKNLILMAAVALVTTVNSQAQDKLQVTNQPQTIASYYEYDAAGFVVYAHFPTYEVFITRDRNENVIYRQERDF